MIKPGIKVQAGSPSPGGYWCFSSHTSSRQHFLRLIFPSHLSLTWLPTKDAFLPVSCHGSPLVPGGRGKQSRHPAEGMAGVTAGVLQGHWALRPLGKTESQPRQKAKKGGLTDCSRFKEEWRTHVDKDTASRDVPGKPSWVGLGASVLCLHLILTNPLGGTSYHRLPLTGEEAGSGSKVTCPRPHGGGWRGPSPPRAPVPGITDFSLHMLVRLWTLDPLSWTPLAACFQNSGSWTPPRRSNPHPRCF